MSWLPASRDAGWPSRVAAKPGACPLLLRGSLGPCMETCRSDGDCAGAEKCCSTSCGHICKLPVAGKGGGPQGREGRGPCRESRGLAGPRRLSNGCRGQR